MKQDCMLTVRQAYDAMYAFLTEYHNQTKSDDVASLLGDLSTLPDGQPADSACWSDWEDSVSKALANAVDTQLGLDRGDSI